MKSPLGMHERVKLKVRVVAAKLLEHLLRMHERAGQGRPKIY